MKKLFLVIICLLCLDASGQLADSLRPPAFGASEREILRQSEGYLRSSFRYTTTINGLIFTGGTLFCIDLADGELNGLGVVGFEIGFGGTEMSKYSPVALVKARKRFSQLRASWPDKASYEQVLKKIRLAETLSKVSVACTFVSEGLIILGALQEDDNMRQMFFITGVVTGGVALGMLIGTTVATQQARIELGRSAGSLGLSAGTSGVGVVYRLP